MASCWSHGPRSSLGNVCPSLSRITPGVTTICCLHGRPATFVLTCFLAPAWREPPPCRDVSLWPGPAYAGRQCGAGESPPPPLTAGRTCAPAARPISHAPDVGRGKSSRTGRRSATRPPCTSFQFFRLPGSLAGGLPGSEPARPIPQPTPDCRPRHASPLSAAAGPHDPATGAPSAPCQFSGPPGCPRPLCGKLPLHRPVLAAASFAPLLRVTHLCSCPPPVTKTAQAQ